MSRAALLLLALATVVVGCANDPSQSSIDSGMDSAPSALPSSQPVSTESAPPATETSTKSTSKLSIQPQSQRSVVRAGAALLRKGCVRGIGEAEPPHGDSDADLAGQWDGHFVIARVAPEGVAMVPGEVIASQEVDGVEVLTMKLPGQQRVLRFPYGDYMVDLRVVDDDSQFLANESSLLLGSILTPTNCG